MKKLKFGECKTADEKYDYAVKVINEHNEACREAFSDLAPEDVFAMMQQMEDVCMCNGIYGMMINGSSRKDILKKAEICITGFSDVKKKKMANGSWNFG